MLSGNPLQGWGDQPSNNWLGFSSQFVRYTPAVIPLVNIREIT